MNILTRISVLTLWVLGIWSVARPLADETITRNVMVPMRDGKALAIDLFFPSDSADTTGFATVLVCTPYGKDNGEALLRWRECLVGHGYAFAVQDMRGFHNSAAAGRGSPRGHDGYDTVEWIASQSWSNGRVGMMGYSHLGAVQYETAVTAPPHLTCAMPAQAPGNYYTDAHFPPSLRKADFETLFRGRFTTHTQSFLRRRIRSGGSDRIPQFTIPMLHCAGWYDFYTEGAIEMFRLCQEKGGPLARGSQRLIIGPWGHGVIQETDGGRPLVLDGGLAYPPNAKLDWPQEVWLPWFNRWLKPEAGAVTGQPAVLYYLMGDPDQPQSPGNCWVSAPTFPPSCQVVSWYAHADGTLTADSPAADAGSRSFRYDPADPVPTVGRIHARLPVKGPLDQSPVEGRPDVLVFTTPVLDTPMAIVGHLRAVVWASSDRTDTDFTVKLTDVYPDGRSMLICDSIVKGRHRRTYLQEEMLTPGKVYEFPVDLGYIAIVLAPGHRLRMAVSSSNFDRFDINPNSGEPYGDHALSRDLMAKRLRGGSAPPGRAEYTDHLVATNTVFMDVSRATRVALPIVAIEDLVVKQR